jgi:hypothetical protein
LQPGTIEIIINYQLLGIPLLIRQNIVISVYNFTPLFYTLIRAQKCYLCQNRGHAPFCLHFSPWVAALEQQSAKNPRKDQSGVLGLFCCCKNIETASLSELIGRSDLRPLAAKS